jgi:hypothetical protein
LDDQNANLWRRGQKELSVLLATAHMNTIQLNLIINNLIWLNQSKWFSFDVLITYYENNVDSISITKIACR